MFCLVYLNIGQCMSAHKLLSVMFINHQLCDFFFLGNDFLTTLFTIQRHLTKQNVRQLQPIFNINLTNVFHITGQSSQSLQVFNLIPF